MRPIFFFVFYLSFNCVAQTPLEIYVESDFFIKHKDEALAAYQEVVDGKVGSVLTKFIEDTVKGAKSKRWIDELLASEDFKLAKVLDTIYIPGTGASEYLTLVNVRRIKQNDDRTFDWYSVDIGIQWNKKFEVFGRGLGYHKFTIRTKEDWNTYMRKYPCPKFLPSR